MNETELEARDNDPAWQELQRRDAALDRFGEQARTAEQAARYHRQAIQLDADYAAEAEAEP